MKIRFMSLLLALCMALSLFPTMTMAANITLSAVPSKTNFVMNGKPVSITQAYDVSSTNYLQVRAIAALLNGTASQFNVSWDGQYAVIETGKPYSGTVAETELKHTTNVRWSGTKFKLDNTVVTFGAALLIDGDTNYLQLREFAQQLSGTASQFNVYWDSAASQAVIQPGAAYTGIASAVINPNVTLYEVLREGEFRVSPDGDIIGDKIPEGTILEVTSIEGSWAKIKWKGYSCYFWTEYLQKVSAPNIVCSAWAKDWLSYTGSYIGLSGEWTGAKEDWTKPVTRSFVADLLVGIMSDIYGAPSVRFSLPITIKDTGSNPLTDTNDYEANRLAYWGVVPTGKFNPSSTVTYGEMTNYLYKLMAYDDKYIAGGGRQDFTKADIAKFGIGGNTSANAKCTIEQAKILCDKAFLWRQEVGYKSSAKSEAAGENSNGRVGVAFVVTGDLYTIKTCLGTKGQQPYLVINAEGKGELSSSKTQSYRITYKGMKLNEDGDPLTLCTIQTVDGKYLATSGLPMNGSRLITRTASYVWEIRLGPQSDYQQLNYMVSADNQWQVLNASGWNTADGTPIITWNWNQGHGGDNYNCAFIFEKVK